MQLGIMQSSRMQRVLYSARLSVQDLRSSDPHSILRTQRVTRGINLNRDHVKVPEYRAQGDHIKESTHNASNLSSA